MKAPSVLCNRPVGLLADKTWQLLTTNLSFSPALFFLKNGAYFMSCLSRNNPEPKINK